MRRAWGGQFTPLSESNSTFSPAAMRPKSGRTNPAMQSSTVDFPEPEGPKRIVIPVGTWIETSSTNGDEPARERSNFTRAVSVAAFTSPPTVSTNGG
jgi:hypothetical protein